MNRRYEVKDFVDIVEFLSRAVPGVTLSTDIIVGFPYETEEDHRATMTLLKALDLNIVHYSRYYPRPHTVASRFEQLPKDVVKRRVKELSDWFKGLDPYSSLVGKFVPVWVSNERVNGSRSCHTKEYIKVLVEDNEAYADGEVLLVKTTSATRFHLNAKVVSSLPSCLKCGVCPQQLVGASADAVRQFF